MPRTKPKNQAERISLNKKSGGRKKVARKASAHGRTAGKKRTASRRKAA